MRRLIPVSFFVLTSFLLVLNTPVLAEFSCTVADFTPFGTWLNDKLSFDYSDNEVSSNLDLIVQYQRKSYNSREQKCKIFTALKRALDYRLNPPTKPKARKDRGRTKAYAGNTINQMIKWWKQEQKNKEDRIANLLMTHFQSELEAIDKTCAALRTAYPDNPDTVKAYFKQSRDKLVEQVLALQSGSQTITVPGKDFSALIDSLSFFIKQIGDDLEIQIADIESSMLDEDAVEEIVNEIIANLPAAKVPGQRRRPVGR